MHTFLFDVVSVSVHLIGSHLIHAGIAWGEDPAKVHLLECWISIMFCMLGCSVRTQVMLGTVHLVGIRLPSGLAAPSTFSDVFMCVVYVRFIELSGDGPLRCIGYALCGVVRLAILSVLHVVAVEVCRLSQHVHCCCPLAVFRV